MKLSDRLRRPVDFRPTALPALNQLSSAAQRILSRWPDTVVEPPEQDRERIVREVALRLRDNDWTGASMSQVTSAAIALYDLERRDRDDLAHVRKFYCDEIASSNRATFLNAMFAVFIGSYVPNARHTVELAESLNSARERICGRWAPFIRSIPECLDAQNAHEAIAARMAAMEQPWDQLRELGLRSPHAPGVMDYVHLSFIAHSSAKLHERASIDRFLNWLQPSGQHARVTGAAEAISALLKPWQKLVPLHDDRHELIRRLTTMYGDPRVRSENAIWSGVPSELTAVMERWLTGENIRFFLDVVSAVERSHMWEPRKRFWLGLHEQNRIDAAWVAFSAEAIERANERTGDGEFLRFGRQAARGTRDKTSLLILKVGNKIVIEGSHDYKVHVFRDDDPLAPKLYQESYNCEAIRFLPGSWAQTHNGDWQGRVLERI